ncbi:unnamed protein product [Symbiodinium sp. KB8]|nr:unnamed protein product [Symbiodinium sp. KB8]
MFENVCTLSKPPCDGDRQVVGPSNLSSVVHLLRASGRWTHVWQLNSTLFGSAQSRPRLWGVSFTLEDLAMDETCAHELLDELMSHCAEVERSALDDFLLPEKHPIVQAQHKEDFEKAFAQPAADSLDIGKLFESAGAVSVSPKARVGGKRNADMEATRPRKRARTSYPGQASPKWSSAHRHAYESLDEEVRNMVPNYVDPTGHLLGLHPALGRLTQRQREILHLKGVLHVPENSARVIDLSQQLSFATLAEDKMPCVTPSGGKFLTHRARFLHGVEAMRFQGLEFDVEKLASYKSRFLLDLAGNAFEGGTCCATSFAACVFLAINRRCSQQSRNRPETICSAGLPEDPREEVPAEASNRFLDIFD